MDFFVNNVRAESSWRFRKKLHRFFTKFALRREYFFDNFQKQFSAEKALLQKKLHQSSEIRLSIFVIYLILQNRTWDVFIHWNYFKINCF